MVRRRLFRSLIVFIVLLAAVAFTLWRMTWAAPSWYQPAGATNEQITQLAEAVENRIVEEAHKVRREERPWTLRVRSEQVNAWLSARLPRWLVHEQNLHWPDELGTPQVRLRADGIDLALLLSPQSSARVIVLRIVPSIVESRLFLLFDRLSLGRLAMPGYTLDDLVEMAGEYGAAEAMTQPEAVWLLDLLGGRDSLEPVTTLADGRRVQLLAVQLGEDHIDLTLQTLGPDRDERPADH